MAPIKVLPINCKPVDKGIVLLMPILRIEINCPDCPIVQKIPEINDNENIVRLELVGWIMAIIIPTINAPVPNPINSLTG